MFPPSQAINVDVDAISGICGSISIACWIVVFSPQIIENFKRGSADGLSIAFLLIWLSGDVFNILGAVLQGVLPTMVWLCIPDVRHSPLGASANDYVWFRADHPSRLLYIG